MLGTVLSSVGVLRSGDEIDSDLNSPTFGQRTSRGGEAMMVAAEPLEIVGRWPSRDHAHAHVHDAP